MSALQAAVGLAQVQRLEELVAHHRSVAERYAAGLRGVAGVALPEPAALGDHAYWMYTVHIEEAHYGSGAYAVREALAREGIETRAVFSPLHVQPILQAGAAPAQGPFPHAAWAARTGINLPSGKTLTSEEIDRVCAVLRAGARGPAGSGAS